MNKVRSITKIGMAASIFAALALTLSCSSDEDKGGGDDPNNGKWCVLGQGEGQKCFKIGANFNGQKFTKANCDIYGAENASIKDEKPEGCEVKTEE